MTSQQYHFNDFEPDQLREVVNGSDLEHTILSATECSATLRRAATPSFSTDSGFYSFPVLVRGQFDPQRLCIGMSQGREKATWINGIEMSGPSLQIYAEGAEMLYRAGRDTEWMAISISRRSLQDAAIEILGAELPLPASGMINHVISASMARRLLELVRSQPTFSEGLPGYENLILIAIVTAIASANHEKPHHSTARAIRRLEIVSRADRAIRDLVGSRYSSEALCRAVGASERSIQTHFQEAFGMSPKSCFTTLALNQARTVLMNTDFRPGIIAETALKFGFEHLGRFSESYRDLFSELPSASVARNR